MELIDKKSTLEAVNNVGGCDGSCDYDKGYDDAVGACYRAVEDMAPVQLVGVGRWVPVEERLPMERINPVTRDFYEYEVTFKSDNIYDVRHYKFGRGHWWHCGECMDDYVIAWMPLPEPYRPE